MCFLFNDGLTEISGNIVLSFSQNFPSQAFLETPFSANKISNCSFFLFPINLCSLWVKCLSIVREQSCVLLGRISRIEKKPSWGKKVEAVDTLIPEPADLKFYHIIQIIKSALGTKSCCRVSLFHKRSFY